MLGCHPWRRFCFAGGHKPPLPHKTPLYSADSSCTVVGSNRERPYGHPSSRIPCWIPYWIPYYLTFTTTEHVGTERLRDVAEYDDLSFTFDEFNHLKMLRGLFPVLGCLHSIDRQRVII